MTLSVFSRCLLFTISLWVSLCFSSAATGQVQFDFVTIGNPGNEGTGSFDRGAVADEFRMATKEVTNQQYAEFLNATAATADPFELYSTVFGLQDSIVRTGTDGNFSYDVVAGLENRPASGVTWYSSIRFVNWLHNGQPADGTGTESGAYEILDGLPIPDEGDLITREAEAIYFLPSEDEWFKAAYHDSSAGLASEYFLYANGSNTAPEAAFPADNLSGANYDRFIEDTVDVGSYTNNTSTYGVFDLNGNVAEWTELQVFTGNRGSAGGDSLSRLFNLQSTFSGSDLARLGSIRIGFRVSTVKVLRCDVNRDGTVDFLDIAPFITLLSRGDFQEEADCNEDGVVNFLDIAPFISALAGSGS